MEKVQSSVIDLGEEVERHGAFSSYQSIEISAAGLQHRLPGGYLIRR
jgi:hypothetical protein